MVGLAHCYGTSIELGELFDRQSNGGGEATVKITKGDLVPAAANRLPSHSSWGELADACEVFLERVGTRAYSITRRPSVRMLAQERDFLIRDSYFVRRIDSLFL